MVKLALKKNVSNMCFKDFFYLFVLFWSGWDIFFAIAFSFLFFLMYFSAVYLHRLDEKRTAVNNSCTHFISSHMLLVVLGLFLHFCVLVRAHQKLWFMWVSLMFSECSV